MLENFSLIENIVNVFILGTPNYLENIAEVCFFLVSFSLILLGLTFLFMSKFREEKELFFSFSFVISLFSSVVISFGIQQKLTGSEKVCKMMKLEKNNCKFDGRVIILSKENESKNYIELLKNKRVSEKRIGDDSYGNKLDKLYIEIDVNNDFSLTSNKFIAIKQKKDQLIKISNDFFNNGASEN